MAVGDCDLRLAAALLGVSSTVAGCGQANGPPLSYTVPAGSIDERPDPLWGDPYPDTPPAPDGRPFDPTKGLGIQLYADRLIGRRVAHFVGHRWDVLRSGAEINEFYPAARAGPGPGMCETRGLQVTGGFFGSRLVKTSAGKWLEPVYTVAGSLPPVSAAGANDYRGHLEQACRRRTDMDMWFSAEPGRAYLAARLADAVVAAARKRAKLPFRLHCRPYPPDIHDRPQCAKDVRAITASIKSRAILQVGECYEEPRPDCVSVDLAKVPERSTRIEDRWTLDIEFDQKGSLTITDVALSDTRIIID